MKKLTGCIKLELFICKKSLRGVTKKLEVKSAVEKRITNIAGKNVNRHQQQDKSQAEKNRK